MQLTACLLLLFSITVSARSLSQTISYSGKNVPLEKVFPVIEKQTGYYIFYSKDDIRNKTVTIHASKSSIEDFMTLLLKDQSLTYSFEGRNISIKRKPAVKALPVVADPVEPPVELRGKIVDEDGQPVQGATISVKGDNKATATNTQGEFVLRDVSDNAVLIISSIGFETQEVSVGGRSLISLQLKKSTNRLDEVQVVAYGTTTKRLNTSAVSEIKGTDIIKSPAVNLSNNIAGRVPGVIATNTLGEPGNDDARLLIRGINTFSGSTAPLIVIDGVANRPGGFQRLNPSDIESISILKDASAAIYGAQAANGVILVTTKRGTPGKAQLNINFNQAINSWVKIPEMVGSADYAVLVNEQRQFQGQAPLYTAEEIEKFRNGSDPLLYPNTNWVDQVIRDVVGQTRGNISLSGGNENASYYLSYGKIHQSGQFKNSDIYSYNQDNLLMNLDVKPIKNVKLSFDGQLRVQKRLTTPTSDFNMNSFNAGGSFTVFEGLLASLPIFPARFPDGKLGIGNNVNTFRNPLATTTGLGGQGKFRNLYSLNTFRYRIDMPWLVDGLYIDGFGSADFQYSQRKDFLKSWTVYRYDGATDEYIEERQTLSPEGLATLNQGTLNSRTYTVNFKLNYTKVLAGIHNIHAFAAFEQQKYRDEYFKASRRNFFSDNIDELDYGSTNNATNEGNGSNFARRNYFGRINYAFKNKYIVEVQGRYDGSDKFSSEKRWGFFPSVSLGWRLSEETWMAGITNGNELKLRGSWGILGNDAIAPYQFLQFYNLDANGYVLNGQPVPTITPGVLPNSNFTWEQAKTVNIAVDGGLWGNRLTYTVEVFKQKRSDVLTQRNATVPAYTGLILPVENIGIVENKGIEGQVLYRIPTAGTFQLSAGANFTYARNKVIFVDEPESVPQYQRQVGQPINSQNMYIAVGIFQSQDDIDKYATYNLGQIARPGDVKFQDINNDGVINFLDQVRTDLNNTPEIMYGFTLNGQWKGIDLSVLFQGQGRSKVFFYPESATIINYYKFLFDGRSTPDKVTDIPSPAGDNYSRPQNNPNTYSFYWRSTAFLRLKNVEIGYTFPKLMQDKMRMKNLRVYVNASNLLTFAKFNDIDPESLNSTNGRGYPILRTVNFGLTTSF
ncbi:MAG: TonB-dependent receptor [Chitinophagaceae bacterium]|nr:TonB-dependent receptor [Chitinophagaceae bacterium]